MTVRSHGNILVLFLLLIVIIINNIISIVLPRRIRDRGSAGRAIALNRHPFWTANGKIVTTYNHSHSGVAIITGFVIITKL
jgi:hypothetical protein